MHLESLHVFMVEDSIMARNKLTEFLEEMSITKVTEAGSGDAALELLERLKEDQDLPDLILLDWNMPQKDGLEVLRAIRENDIFNNIRVLMVSAERDKGQIVNALKSGANGFLSKPVTAEILKEKIKEILSLDPAKIETSAS